MGFTWKMGLLLCFLAGFTLLDVEGIVCYDCNSENDPRCGDPFVPHSIGTINCSYRTAPKHMEEAKPTLCRKMIQYVYGQKRITRGCGYLKDEGRDDKECLKRSGTRDVFATYCSCTGDLCNGSMPAIGHGILHSAFLLLLIIAVLNIP